MAQRFYNLVLLPRIRDDLSEYRKLNAHLYNAMRKALFKPAAFMKGIILPLLEVSFKLKFIVLTNNNEEIPSQVTVHYVKLSYLAV